MSAHSVLGFVGGMECRRECELVCNQNGGENLGWSPGCGPIVQSATQRFRTQPANRLLTYGYRQTRQAPLRCTNFYPDVY